MLLGTVRFLRVLIGMQDRLSGWQSYSANGATAKGVLLAGRRPCAGVAVSLLSVAPVFVGLALLVFWDVCVVDLDMLKVTPNLYGVDDERKAFVGIIYAWCDMLYKVLWGLLGKY